MSAFSQMPSPEEILHYLRDHSGLPNTSSRLRGVFEIPKKQKKHFKQILKDPRQLDFINVNTITKLLPH